MSEAEGILWFACTFLAAWGASLIVRGGLGERVGRKRARTHTVKTNWRLILLGVLSLGGAGAAAWGATVVAAWFSWTRDTGLTPWHAGGLGVAAFALALLVWFGIGDRARGRRRCPKCWYDMSAWTEGPCPECGRPIKAESALLRSRRSRWLVAFGAVFVVAAAGSFTVGEHLRKGGTYSELIPLAVLRPIAARDLGNTTIWARDIVLERDLTKEQSDKVMRALLEPMKTDRDARLDQERWQFAYATVEWDANYPDIETARAISIAIEPDLISLLCSQSDADKILAASLRHYLDSTLDKVFGDMALFVIHPEHNRDGNAAGQVSTPLPAEYEQALAHPNEYVIVAALTTPDPRTLLQFEQSVIDLLSHRSFFVAESAAHVLGHLSHESERSWSQMQKLLLSEEQRPFTIGTRAARVLAQPNSIRDEAWIDQRLAAPLRSETDKGAFKPAFFAAEERGPRANAVLAPLIARMLTAFEHGTPGDPEYRSSPAEMLWYLIRSDQSAGLEFVERWAASESELLKTSAVAALWQHTGSGYFIDEEFAARVERALTPLLEDETPRISRIAEYVIEKLEELRAADDSAP